MCIQPGRVFRVLRAGLNAVQHDCKLSEFGKSLQSCCTRSPSIKFKYYLFLITFCETDEPSGI